MSKEHIIERTRDIIFLKRAFRTSIFVAIFLVAINLLVLFKIYYTILSKQEGQYFATTEDGRVIEIFPD